MAAGSTVPVPEMWIALHASALSASIPNVYSTPGWLAATADTPTGQAARPTIPPNTESRVEVTWTSRNPGS